MVSLRCLDKLNKVSASTGAPDGIGETFLLPPVTLLKLMSVQDMLNISAVCRLLPSHWHVKIC